MDLTDTWKLGARVFGLTFYHSLAGKEEAYFTGFLLVQPLAYLFVRRRVFTRVILPAAYWYGMYFPLALAPFGVPTTC
jgi:hypothetical protein